MNLRCYCMHLLKILAVLLVILLTPAANAQEVPGADLVDPWAAAKDIILSMPKYAKAFVEQEKRAQLDRQLKILDDQLRVLREQKDRVATRLLDDPNFRYDSAFSSYEMAEQIKGVIATFDGIFSDLAIREESDAKKTRAAMDKLRQLLYEKHRLEQDVVKARGSHDPRQLSDLAERWRSGATSVMNLRDAIAIIRKELQQK